DTTRTPVQHLRRPDHDRELLGSGLVVQVGAATALAWGAVQCGHSPGNPLSGLRSPPGRKPARAGRRHRAFPLQALLGRDLSQLLRRAAADRSRWKTLDCAVTGC